VLFSNSNNGAVDLDAVRRIARAVYRAVRELASG
jgi:hypothetical protein